MKALTLASLILVGAAGLPVPQKQDDPAPRTVSAAPANDEAIIVFDNGAQVRAKKGSLISIPSNEKLRGVYGADVRVALDSKGETSGNNIWSVVAR